MGFVRWKIDSDIKVYLTEESILMNIKSSPVNKYVVRARITGVKMSSFKFVSSKNIYVLTYSTDLGG